MPTSARQGWGDELTTAQIEAYLADEVSITVYNAHLQRKVGIVTSALRAYLKSYHRDGSDDHAEATSFLWPEETKEGILECAKRSCMGVLERLPYLMEVTWGVATLKGFGDCCHVRRKPRPSEESTMEKVTVLRSEAFHYRCLCVLHIVPGTGGDLVLGELVGREEAVRETSKLLSRVYHPVIVQCMPQIRKHLAGVEGKVSIILCSNAGEMLITVHLENGVAETVSEGSLQAAVQSSSAELKRVVVDVIVNGKRSRLASTTSAAGCNGALSRSSDELCHGRSSERDSRRSRKTRDAFVTEYYHLGDLHSDIRLRFKDGFRAVANSAVESRKLNWMVRTAIKCLFLLPVRGRRQLLEIPRSTSLYAVALGNLFDDSVCVVEGHKGKVAAAWGKLRLNSLVGKVKIVRGCPSSKIEVLRGHEFDMAVVTVETSGIGDEVRSYLSTVPCIMYISEYTAAVRRDIRLLSISHRVLDLGLFDFLPFDEVIECCVVMLRRDVV